MKPDDEPTAWRDYICKRGDRIYVVCGKTKQEAAEAFADMLGFERNGGIVTFTVYNLPSKGTFGAVGTAYRYVPPTRGRVEQVSS